MRKIYFLLFIAIQSQIIIAQKATIKGTVVDSRTKETLVGVNVYAEGGQGTTTDIFGNYVLEINAGDCKINYTFVGYAPVKREFNIKADEQRIMNISMLEDSKILEEVVVSAGRHEQKLADLTVSVELLKPEILENTSTTSLEKALQRVPGVTIYEDQASIRGGSGYSYGAGSRVLLLMDDLPLLSGSSGEAKWFIIPIENIDQVEIIKGAASAMYGSSAMNGIMNVRTGWPTNHPQTKLISYSGLYLNPERSELKWWGNTLQSFNGYQIMHSQKFGNFDLVVNGNLYNDQGYRKDQKNQRLGLNVKTRYRSKKVEGLTYGLNANAFRRWGTNFLFWRAEKEFDTNLNDSVYKAYPYEPGGTVMEQTNTYAIVDPFITYYRGKNKHSLKGRMLYINNENDDEQNNKDYMYYGEYQFQRALSESMVLNAGASALYCDSEADIFGNMYHYSSAAAIFTQLDKKFKKLNLSFGARIEGYGDGSEKMEWKPVLRAGANYQIAKTTFARASFGQGYRYPTIAEKYTQANMDAVNVLPNNNLKSETGWSVEAALKQGFTFSNWQGYIDVAGFFTEYNDMIEFRFDTHIPDNWSPGSNLGFEEFFNELMKHIGFKALNISKVQISGLDVGLAGQGAFGNLPVRFLAGYTFINPVDFSKDTNNTTSFLKYRFRHNAKIDLEVSYKQLSIGGSFEYFSKMVAIDKIFEEEVEVVLGNLVIPTGIYVFPGMKEYRQRNEGGEYYIDMRVAWDINANSKLAIVLKNALNREYMIRPGDVQPPRNITLQYSLRL